MCSENFNEKNLYYTCHTAIRDKLDIANTTSPPVVVPQSFSSLQPVTRTNPQTCHCETSTRKPVNSILCQSPFVWLSCCSPSRYKWLSCFWGLSKWFQKTFKRSIVRPLLKKTSLGPNCLQNYRPVSTLLFPSKDHWKDSSLSFASSLQHKQPARPTSVRLQNSPQRRNCFTKLQHWKGLSFVSSWSVCRIWRHRKDYPPFSPWIFIRYLWHRSFVVQILRDRCLTVSASALYSTSALRKHGVPQGTDTVSLAHQACVSCHWSTLSVAWKLCRWYTIAEVRLDIGSLTNNILNYTRLHLSSKILQLCCSYPIRM